MGAGGALKAKPRLRLVGFAERRRLGVVPLEPYRVVLLLWLPWTPRSLLPVGPSVCSSSLPFPVGLLRVALTPLGRAFV